MANKTEYTAQDCLTVLQNGNPVIDPNDRFMSFVRNFTKNIYCFKVSNRDRGIDSEPIVFFDYEKDARQSLLLATIKTDIQIPDFDIEKLNVSEYFYKLKEEYNINGFEYFRSSIYYKIKNLSENM